MLYHSRTAGSEINEIVTTFICLLFCSRGQGNICFCIEVDWGGIRGPPSGHLTTSD